MQLLVQKQHIWIFLGWGVVFFHVGAPVQRVVLDEHSMNVKCLSCRMPYAARSNYGKTTTLVLFLWAFDGSRLGQRVWPGGFQEFTDWIRSDQEVGVSKFNGSGQEVVKSRGSGSVTLTRPDPIRPEPSRPARSDPTREKALVYLILHGTVHGSEKGYMPLGT